MQQISFKSDISLNYNFKEAKFPLKAPIEKFYIVASPS